MSRKQLIILAVTGGFIVLVVIIGVLSGDGWLSGSSLPNVENESPINGTGVMESGRQLFTPEVPVDAVITPPAIEAPVSPGSTASVKIFSVSISRNGYEPSTITVNRGDNVDLRLTATDGDYDWSLPAVGYYQSMKKGEMKRVVFDAALVGTFRFECRDLCPLGGKISWELIVVP